MCFWMGRGVNKVLLWHRALCHWLHDMEFSTSSFIYTASTLMWSFLYSTCIKKLQAEPSKHSIVTRLVSPNLVVILMKCRPSLP